MTGIRDAGEYRIQAVGDIGIHAEDRWVAVLHTPCDEYVYGDESDQWADELDLATVLSLIAAHRCGDAAEGLWRPPVSATASHLLGEVPGP